MGAWGESPFESDDFGDIHDKVVHAVQDQLIKQTHAAMERAKKSGDPHLMWAAIGVAIRTWHSGYLDKDQRHDVGSDAEELYKLIGKTDFASTWRSPASFKKMWKRVGEEIEYMTDYSGSPAMAESVFLDVEDNQRNPGHRRQWMPSEVDLGGPTLSYSNWTTVLGQQAAKTGARIAYGAETHDAWKAGQTPEEYVRSLGGARRNGPDLEEDVGIANPSFEVGDTVMQRSTGEHGVLVGMGDGEAMVRFGRKARWVKTGDLLHGLSPTNNPRGTFTAKGERMYEDIKAGYGMDPRAAEIAARTVYARAAEGASGLVKKR